MTVTHMTVTEWNTELTKLGAQFVDGAIQHYGNPDTELENCSHQDCLYDLSHIGVLSLKGSDAINFLQGQVTNDVMLLTKNQAHYSGYCTAKGRLLAIFLAYTQQDKVFLQMPQALLESVMKRLKMYVMRSKVEIQQATNVYQFGISGPNAKSILNQFFTNIPIENNTLEHDNNATIIKLPSINALERYQIIASVEHALSIWQQLKEKCTLAGKPCWDWLEVNAGIPEISINTQEAFVPQMVNLDLLNGINFKKGCYTGQEIVARTHYLGTVKRRTFLAEIQTKSSPQASDKLFDASNNEVGQIVRVAKNSHGFDVLAELRLDARESGKIYWLDQALDFKDLPYLITNESR